MTAADDRHTAGPLGELRTSIDRLMTLMTAVATHEAEIENVRRDYADERRTVGQLCQRLGLEDPNPHRDLWSWYGHWSRELPTYQSRREYVIDLYSELLDAVDALEADDLADRLPDIDLEGWPAVQIMENHLRVRLATAEQGADAQAVGLLCRDLMITLADAVYEEAQHGVVENESAVSKLNAVVNHHAAGRRNENLRRLVKSVIDYANTVQHRRGAGLDEAGLAAEATLAAVHLIRRVSAIEP